MGNCLKRGVWTVFKLIGVGGGGGWGGWVGESTSKRGGVVFKAGFKS